MLKVFKGLIVPIILLFIIAFALNNTKYLVPSLVMLIILYPIVYFLKSKYTQWKYENKKLGTYLLLFVWILFTFSIVTSVTAFTNKQDFLIDMSVLLALIFGAFPINLKVRLSNNSNKDILDNNKSIQNTIDLPEYKYDDFIGFKIRQEQNMKEYTIPKRFSTKFTQYIDYLYSLSPYEFEKLVAEVLKAYFGEKAEVILTQASRDKGVDIMINLQDDVLGGKYLVQVKRYKNNVGEPELKQFLGTLHDNRAKGIFVTLSGFSELAKKLAKEHNITLIDGEKLIEMIKRYKIIEINEEIPETKE